MISLNGGADDALLNYFTDTSVVYESFLATGRFRFNKGCGSNASVGFFMTSAEGEGYLYVGITRGGNLIVYCNGKRIQLPDAQGKTVNVSDGFTLCVTLAGKHLRIEANGYLLSETVSDQFVIKGHAGVNATEDGVFTAESVYFSPLTSAAPEIQIAITKVQGDNLTVTVARDTAKETIIEKLPKTAKAWNQNGQFAEFALTWVLDNLDTSAAGTYTVKGYPMIEKNSLTVNPLGMALRCTVRIMHDPDRTELNEAIALMESLREEDYSAETWQAAQEAYNNALGLASEDVPQNAVTVAAVFLMEKINALNPTGIDFSALDAAIASLKAQDLSNADEDVRKAIDLILDEAEAFSRSGPVTQRAVNDLIARLTDATDELKNVDTTVEQMDETDKDQADSGCRSAIGAAGIIAVLTAGVAAMLRKKKEDN